MQVTIVFKGIGISYTKNDISKIIFPVDKCHQLTFAYQKNQGEMISIGAIANAGEMISIEPVKTISEFGTAADIVEFIDLTADYSHAQGINFKPNWRKQAVEMNLNNVFLSVGSYSEKEFVLSEGSTITMEPKVVGASLKAITEIAEGGKLNIQVDDQNLKSFEYEADANYTLVFDNDCYEKSTVTPTIFSPGKNDFYLYYNVIEDAHQAKREFSLVAVPESSDRSKFIVTENLALLIDLTSPKPVVDYPCYPVRASKINSTFP